MKSLDEPPSRDVRFDQAPLSMLERLYENLDKIPTKTLELMLYWVESDGALHFGKTYLHPDEKLLGDP